MLDCSQQGGTKVMETLYTVEEVAQLLKVSAFTVRRWLTTGQLHGIKFEGFWRVSESDLNAFIEDRRSKGG